MMINVSMVEQQSSRLGSQTHAAAFGGLTAGVLFSKKKHSKKSQPQGFW